MYLKTHKKLILILFIFLLYNCQYNEQEALKKQNIKKRIVYNVNYKNSKTPLYVEYFNKSGRLVKRRDYDASSYLYQTYKYDSTGNFIKRIWHNEYDKNLHSENYCLYDKYGNFIYCVNKQIIPKHKIIYYKNNKLKTFILFFRNKYSKIFFYSYDWLGRLSVELKVSFENSSSLELTKIKYTYDIFGRLKSKKIFKRRVAGYSILKNGELIFTDPIDEKYKLKYIYEYKYNDQNLLSEEIKYSPRGYVLGKTVYEYY